ncbi:hypothetical protein Bca52824_074213 [Brassica carinata]|uniref:Uncharacterized protein n=1 Tax=Brassica carinata TaxID=52824 RepID=A0A8X7U6K3_BRACI|nr:hypothetical protein Bca52824_074213 [Brassica carinata]
MVRSIRLWRGDWMKNGDQGWDFIPDPTDFGFRMLINRSARFETLDMIIRRRYSLRATTPLVVTYRPPSWMLTPQGVRTPPTTISNTSDLCMLLNVRTWLDDLAILVSVGSKSVAEYQFLCRTRFAVGSTTYVFDKPPTPVLQRHLELADRAATTERVMNEIFTEEEMVIFHRVSLEMAYGDSIIAQEPRVNQPVREIIELDDDEDEMVDGNQIANVTGANNGVTELTPPQAAPPILWDVGMDMVNFQAHANNIGATANVLDTGLMCWAGLEVPLTGGGVDVTVPEGWGNVDVGVGNSRLGRENDNTHHNVPTPVALGDVAVGEGSTNDNFTATGVDVMEEDIRVVGADPKNAAPQLNKDVITVGAHDTVPLESVERNSTEEVDPGSDSNGLTQMKELALTCQQRGVGTSKDGEGKRVEETSSEGSSTEGG